MPEVTGTVTVAGVDWGGTWIRAAAVADGRILRRERRAKPASLAEQYATVAELVRRVGGSAVGVGLAGVVQEGLVGTAANLGFTDGTDVAAALRPLLAVPVRLLNDAQAAALGLAARWPHGTTAVLTMGTGIGGAVIRDGALDPGLGGAGDFGHMVVDLGGPRCPCGGTGCLEALVSGRVLASAANALGLPDAAALVAAAGRGDERAAGVLDRSALALAAGVRSIVAAHDPHRIVLAGAPLAPDTWLGRAVRAHWDRIRPHWARTELHHAGDDEDAALLGAAAYALDRL
ncbi:ROK family protein [Dactylosporangium sp. CS-047395]|uniref:ROK family protein n=1 Tax=Dactylosporangium sp. CS-047395 TaxID=3239936 RepID=UPI003D8A79FC